MRRLLKQYEDYWCTYPLGRSAPFRVVQWFFVADTNVLRVVAFVGRVVVHPGFSFGTVVGGGRFLLLSLREVATKP